MDTADLTWNTFVSQILAHKEERIPLITVPGDASLRLAMEVLKDSHFTGIPVVNESGDIRGIVDNLDLLRYLQSSFKDSMKTWSSVGHLDEVLDTPVSEVMDNSQDDTLIFGTPEMTLGSILRFFARGLAHRCIINDGDGEQSILTQGDIVRFLATHPGLDEIMDKKLSELINLSKAICAPEDISLYDLIDLMQQNHLSGMALLDQEGHIIGNFSASDLNKIDKIDADLLLTPASQFLIEKSPDSLDLITLPTNATLRDAFKTFTEYGIHRLWLVEDWKPAFVVTLTDILKIFVKT